MLVRSRSIGKNSSVEATLNRVELIGRLPEDARNGYLENGMAITKFYVEVGRREYSEDPDIVIKSAGTVRIPCVIFNKVTIGAALIEGMRVMVMGYLDQYTKIIDDESRVITNVVVRNVIMMDKYRRQQSPPVTIPPKVPTQQKRRKPWQK